MNLPWPTDFCRRSEAWCGRAGPRHSGAFSLIECLVYMSLLAVVMALSMQVFFQSRESSDQLRRHADEITRMLHAGERWRDDVRSATAPLHLRVTDYQTWLTIPRGKNLTVYTIFKSGVWRQEHGGAAWTPTLAAVKLSRMEPDVRAHVSAWRWEVELPSKDSKQTKPRFTFLAVAPRTNQP